MPSGKKSFQTKDSYCVIDNELQKLFDRGFVIKIPSVQVDQSQPEWHLPLHAVFTPERNTKVLRQKVTLVSSRTIISRNVQITSRICARR